MAIDWGVWDFVSSGGESENPEVAVKSVRNTIPSDTIDAITRSPIPLKIILVEGQNPNLDRLMGQAILLSSVGCGVYVRNYGWLTLPSRRITVPDDDINFIKSKRWQKDPERGWIKRCRECGEHKTPDEYYQTGKTTGYDPFRHICKACDNSKRAKNARKT